MATGSVRIEYTLAGGVYTVTARYEGDRGQRVASTSNASLSTAVGSMFTNLSTALGGDLSTGPLNVVKAPASLPIV